VVDEHGVAVCCVRVHGALRTCHDAVKHTIARSAMDAGFRVEVEVHGVFTRALREADRRRMGAYSVHEKHRGLCRTSSSMTRTTSSRAFTWTARALITMAGCVVPVVRSTGVSPPVSPRRS
jgi:hypothetical protein